jgi:hypothetical protein
MKRGDHQQNAAEPNEGVATLKKRTLIVADIRNETRQLRIKYPKRICRRFRRTASSSEMSERWRAGCCFSEEVALRFAQYPLTVPVQGDDAALAIATI